MTATDDAGRAAAPVAKYWPEFADNGKEETTVRQLLAHQAGLVAPEADLTPEDLRAWTPVADTLARQAPAWVPGTAYAYHALTFGWLAGEVLRRATGLRPGQWLREHVVGPLNLTMTFGADPASADLHPLADPLPITEPEAAAMMAAAFAEPMIARSISLGRVFDAARIIQAANEEPWLSVEIPAGNLVTNARSLARLYAATVGEVDGVRLLGPEIVRDARAVRSEGRPFVGPDVNSGWGTGFMTSSVHRPMIGPGSFGHDGLGGCLGFAHPESEIAFAYQTAQPGGLPDDRADALSHALRACL
ncbi:serine hydrolase domain-containing protein [Streptomyces sp. NPDC005820]|uniref:serine hydrolase domain-containing protein n=1 Tax=Streptomyces sp. NPDC005820 TaxID=3157069 RepID=UPI003401D508